MFCSSRRGQASPVQLPSPHSRQDVMVRSEYLAGEALLLRHDDVLLPQSLLEPLWSQHCLARLQSRWGGGRGESQSQQGAACGVLGPSQKLCSDPSREPLTSVSPTRGSPQGQGGGSPALLTLQCGQGLVIAAQDDGLGGRAAGGAASGPRLASELCSRCRWNLRCPLRLNLQAEQRRSSVWHTM